MNILTTNINILTININIREIKYEFTDNKLKKILDKNLPQTNLKLIENLLTKYF